MEGKGKGKGRRGYRRTGNDKGQVRKGTMIKTTESDGVRRYEKEMKRKRKGKRGRRSKRREREREGKQDQGMIKDYREKER